MEFLVGHASLFYRPFTRLLAFPVARYNFVLLLSTKVHCPEKDRSLLLSYLSWMQFQDLVHLPLLVDQDYC